MKWSWKLGRAFGIDIFIHATFVLLLVWVALSAYLRERDAHAMVLGVTFMLAIFGSVLLHELGHAVTAQRFGIRTRDITLLPIGGIARLERMPEKPVQELLVQEILVGKFRHHIDFAIENRPITRPANRSCSGRTSRRA